MDHSASRLVAALAANDSDFSRTMAALNMGRAVFRNLLHFGNVGQPPIGVTTAFVGATAPTGFLKCDGAAVSRVTYAALFNVIGTTYGAGNGTTTFNVPNTANTVIFVGTKALGLPPGLTH